MPRHLAALPTLWTAIAAAEINDSTGISLALFLAGIAGTAAIFWRAGVERQKAAQWRKSLETEVKKLRGEVHGLQIVLKVKQEESK